MKFLRVPPEKLRKYQHYHDERDIAWIKLYTSLLDAERDVDYSLLQDNAKLLLHHLWMLAARTKNKIPYTKDWISKSKLNVRSTINLKPLLAAGFVEIFESTLDDVLVPPLDESIVPHAYLESDLYGSLSSPKEESKEPDLDFDALWNEYPRKRGRSEALKHFRAQIKTRADYVAALSAVRNYARECEQLGTEERFIKHGSTFLNGNWRDYVDGVWKPPSPPKPGKPGGSPRAFVPVRKAD